jgi:spermidine synthase
VTVDTDKDFVKLGKKYFGFCDTDVIESVYEDAFVYVKNAQNKFDLVFMDVCYSEASDDGISPPRHFL